MSNLLNSYPIFENNQVLTSSQLNELVAYLDEQNRLTRAKLIGTGIACGFDLKFRNTAPDPMEITIFKGMGITSEGFLITEGDTVVKRYRPYTLPAGVQYIPFQDPFTTVQDVTLYELLTDDAPTLPTDVIKNLDNPTNFVNDKVVLLFIEMIDVDQKSCLGKACDENGLERMFNLRKLLISKKDMEKILARTCSQTSLFPSKYDLPEIFMKEALFSNEGTSPNTSNYFVFSQTYINALRSTAQPATNITIYDQLFKALKQTYVDFSPILSNQYGGVNPFNALPSATWTNFINGSSAGPRYLGVQYFYDFIKDLILAYNEFRDVAFDLVSECCNDMDCFPQHLMLGEVIPTGSDKPSRYRHYFTLSPIFDQQTEKLARAVSLFQRMVLMTQKMDMPTINNPSTTVIPPSALAVPIYITPSNEKRDPLSKRAIPYYYRIHETSGDLGTLEQSWDYTYKLKAWFSQGLAPLSYRNQDIVQTNDQGPVKTPLFYDTDPYNFLRIEGQLRGPVVQVQQEIEKIKNAFDLPFNVVSLRLAGDPIDDIMARCNFDDLRTEYTLLRGEILSMGKNVFDRFGTITARGIQVRPQSAFIKGLLADVDTGLTGSLHQPQTGVATTRGFVLDGAPSGSVTVPVYAPQRTLGQVKEDINNNVQSLLVSLNALQADLPYNLAAFHFGYTGTVQDNTPAFIQHYLTALQSAINVKVGYIQLVDLIVRNTKVRNTPEMYMEFNLLISEVLNLLERFITDTKYIGLMHLYYTLQYRVNQLKANDMTLFSNFIKKHPGIKHQAGVKPGGTFILVYPGNSVAVDPIRRNIAVNQIREIKGIQLQNARLKSLDVRTVEEESIMKQNDAVLLNYNAVAQEVLLPSIPIQKIAIEALQVVADFSLPYLCCCDCECDSITPPASVTDLGLPAIGTPFYVEYSAGDYAFGKDVQVGTSTPTAYVIDVISKAQYNKTIYMPGQVRLYMVDKFGNKLVFKETVPPVPPSMSSGNYPNLPVYKTATGTVTITTSESGVQQFSYTALDGISVVTDSFYYMFEIVSDESGAVVERSTPGLVTVTVKRGS